MDNANGMIATKGLVAFIEATDAMLKAGKVGYLGMRKVGSGFVCVMVGGDVAACKAAVDAGASAAGKIGEVVSVHVIPRPHADIAKLAPTA